MSDSAAYLEDILIHEYAGVSTKTLWAAITEDLPLLEKAVKKLNKIIISNNDQNFAQ